MRVTNTMLNHASVSSGLPLAHSSLLDHLNNDEGSSMLDALKSRNQVMKKTGYERLCKAAEELSEKTGKAASDSWYDSLAKTVEEKLAKAVGGNDTKGKKESGSENDGNIAGKAEVVNSTVEGKGSNAISDGESSAIQKTALDADTRKEVVSFLKDIVKEYNETSKELLKDANTMNQFYRQELVKAVKSGGKDLGLTLSKSGTLEFDEDKMKKSLTVEELKSTLQPIAKKLSFVSEHVADHASANMNSLSTQYGASGRSYYNAGNRFDSRG